LSTYELNSTIIKYVVQEGSELELSTKTLNPKVFEKLKKILIQGSIRFVQSDLFKSFVFIRDIFISNKYPHRFVHRVGFEWATSLNHDLESYISAHNLSSESEVLDEKSILIISVMQSLDYQT
jgi:hypothetical protein